MKRIKIKHGTARVSNFAPPELIEALNRLAELAYKMEAENKKANNSKN